MTKKKEPAYLDNEPLLHTKKGEINVWTVTKQKNNQQVVINYTIPRVSTMLPLFATLNYDPDKELVHGIHKTKPEE